MGMFWCYSSSSCSLSYMSVLNKVSNSFVGSNWWHQIPCLCMKAWMQRMFSRRVSFILFHSFVIIKFILENVHSTAALLNGNSSSEWATDPNSYKYWSLVAFFRTNPELFRLAVLCVFPWQCVQDSPLFIKLCNISCVQTKKKNEMLTEFFSEHYRWAQWHKKLKLLHISGQTLFDLPDKFKQVFFAAVFNVLCNRYGKLFIIQLHLEL